MMKVFSVRQSVKSGFPLQIPLVAQYGAPLLLEHVSPPGDINTQVCPVLSFRGTITAFIGS